MKVKLKDLKANPYRDLKKYPIKQERVDALKASIEQTGFWDNVLARPSGKKFELAYGHNRLIALQQLGIEEIDIPIKDISDADMVRIMATENREQYDENQSILIETVQTVRDYLTGEFMKYNTYETLPTLLLNLVGVDKKGNPIPIPDQKKAFTQLKNNNTVGEPTILKFLGSGWKPWKIAHALDVLNSEEINPDAIKKFETTGMGVAFTKAIKEINKESNKPLSFKDQEKLADKFLSTKDTHTIDNKTGGGNYYSAIKDIVKAEYIGSQYNKPASKKSEISKEKILKYESYVAEIRNEADSLRQKIRDLISAEKELGQITENVQRKLLSMSLNSLIKQIELLTSNNYYNEKIKQSSTNLECITE